jgi:phenylalanyl-tRNA synthetase alpha chain
MIDNKQVGHLHPISLIINKVSKIFQDIGFSVVDGPELEYEWYNFDALNVPPNHPSRDMQDTFWIETPPNPPLNKEGNIEQKVLRTHTSNMQIRTMERWVKEKKDFPLAVICPGKVYRNEATDATHEANFYQLECLFVDQKEKVSIGNLKWVIENMLSELFKRKISIRFRSSYFPFVEPALEVDMTCFRCGGTGCTTCKQSGWIELGGSGMVHPNTLNMCGIDSEKFAGFAFGFGVDRIAMMLYGIEDVRYLYNGDMRFTSQF